MIATSVRPAILARSFFDLYSGLFVPQLDTWDPETGEFTSIEGPKGFETWEEAGRFLRAAALL